MTVVKDKKDVSALLETQLPEFINANHPKFKKFIEKYYEFMESHQLYFGSTFTFNDAKIVAEEDETTYITYEDEVRVQLESERDTAGNANLMFSLGETLTGNTSGATAVVTGTKGNTIAFVKSTSSKGFVYAEKLTGSDTGAYGTLANGVVDGIFPTGSVDSFRSKAPAAAIRELSSDQDIDTTSVGLINTAWKKEFYTNVPTATYADRRQLLKRMKQVYRSKGNESSFTWVFQTLFNKEDIEFYYPNTDLLKLSDGKWALDKSIKIITSSASNINLFTGRKITGQYSRCTAMVEKQQTTFAGALEVTELTLSDVVQGVVDGILSFFKVNEAITSETDVNGQYATATTSGILQGVDVQVGGTNYVIGDQIHVTGGGGQGALARVSGILDSVVEGIDVVDSGDGYAVGDLISFINDGTGGLGASGQIEKIIPTGTVLKNSDQMSVFQLSEIGIADYSVTLTGHNANSALYGNSSLTFSAGIKASSAKLYNNTGNYNPTLHILAGDRIAKIASVNTSGVTLTQSVKTVTLTENISDEERYNLIGGKLTYANSNTNIITGFTDNNVLTVRDTHTIGSGQTFSVDYASNTYYGTVISANTTAFLYSVGSHYRDMDLGNLTVQNFVNDDNIIVYNNKFTKLGAAAAGSGVDAHSMHNGVTFQVGNTPAAVTTNTFTIVDAHGATPDVAGSANGSLNFTEYNVGAIDSFVLTSGGGGYESSPPVAVANRYLPTLGNALDITGPPNTLLNTNLHSFTTGTISQDGNVVTLDSEETFPDANSGVLTITYANGTTDQITEVVNSTTLKVSEEKIFGIGTQPLPNKETFSLSYMALANNITKSSLLYNDNYTARARVLDFIDKGTLSTANPYIANGNTTLRVDMTTTQAFCGVTESILLEEKNFHNDSYSTEMLLLEDIVAGEGPHSGLGSNQGGGGCILIEDSVTFLTMEDDALICNESDQSRFYAEDTSGDRITAHSNSTSTYTTGTITQSGTTVTGAGTVFPNDFVRGTITYADDATSTITGYTNATSFTVEDSKTVGAGNTYSISYNPVLTWGTNRIISLAAGGSGNRTVTVTESGHYLRTGDKVKITGSGTAIFNGAYPITVINSNSYSYTLPENTGVTSPAGAIRAMPISSLWLSTSNTVSKDTSPKGNNAVIEVSAIAIGAIQSVEVYDFGAGYSSVPVLSTTSGNKNAELTATLGAYATYPGYYTDTTGLLSGVPKVQDNKYYQSFSYVLKTDFDVNDYRNSVKKLTHPSGMIMFGELAIRNKVSAELYRSGERNVDDLGTIEYIAGPDSEGRKYHNITLIPDPSDAINVQFQTFGSNNEMEIYTANHPWQAMDARLETYDNINLQLENFSIIDSIARTNSTMYVVTENSHGYETSDEISFSGDESSQRFEGVHTVVSVPNSNTYTITPIIDYGDITNQVMYDGYLYIQLEDQTSGNTIVMEDDSDLMLEPGPYYLKSEVKEYANTWRASGTNWDSPFAGGVLNEDGTEILLERGGSYLYPKIQFPEAETGVISIDVSFNSDILLEDDNGTYGYGYLLDELSAGMGNGPQRFISLEEDTQGPNHQYESIPIVDTHIIETWYNSTRKHLISEDGLSTFTMEDESLMALDTIPFTQDNSFTKQITHTVHHNTIITEDGSYIIDEGSSGVSNTYFKVEAAYDFRDNNEYKTIFDLVETTHWHLRMEDRSHIVYEDETRMLSEEDYFKTSLHEVETNLVDSIGHHIITEDNLSPLSRVDYVVTATTNVGTPNYYIIDGVQQASLDLQGGRLYRFDVSHTTMTGHPFRFSFTLDGHHTAGGSHYMSGVVVSGTEGSAGAYVDLFVQNSLGYGKLYYHCHEHAGMGSDMDITPREATLHNLSLEDNTRMVINDSFMKPPVIELQRSRYDSFDSHFIMEDGNLPNTVAVTYTVTASGGKYYIDGAESPTLSFTGLRIYRFDVSDSSMGLHPLHFSTTADGSHGGGHHYMNGVEVSGQSGTAGAVVQITAANITQTLYYYCHTHSGMGSSIAVTAHVYSGLINPNIHLGNEDGLTRLLTEHNTLVAANNFYSERDIIKVSSKGFQIVLEDPDTTPITYTVAATGTSPNYFSIDFGDGEGAVSQATINLVGGKVYRFDISDSSMSGHPFHLSYTTDGRNIDGAHQHHLSFNDPNYLRKVGSEGSAGSYYELVTRISQEEKLYYYCHEHAGMGGTLNIRESTGNIALENVHQDTGDPDLASIVLEIPENKITEHTVTVDIHGEVLAFEDDSGYFLTETTTPNRILVSPIVPSRISGQSSSMIPSKLFGDVAFGQNATAVTGTGTSFTSQLSVGDVFQTGDENIILEGSYGTEVILLEDNDRIRAEDIQISELQNDQIVEISGVTVEHLFWCITNEDNNLVTFGVGTGIQGGFDLNTADTSFHILGEDSNAGLELGLEDGDQMLLETIPGDEQPDLLLEDGAKVLFTDPGEFKVSSITNDTSLTVTRKHWEGTDAVPFWKQTTETEVTAAVSYK